MTQVAANRVLWVDTCKAVGIFLVVLGHTLRNELSLVYIYGFHMPLFFFLSGIVFNSEKYDVKSFLKSRFNSLVVPYVFFYVLTWLYWLFVERSFRPIDLSWWQPLLGMIYGAQWLGLMDHNGILWFLPCLFVVETLFFLLSRIRNLKFATLSMFILVMIGFFIKHPLPWCLNVAMTSLQFFFVGSLLRKYFLQGEGFTIRRLFVSAAILILYVLWMRFNPNEVNIASSDYGPVWAYEIGAYLGVMALCLTCKTFTLSNKWGGYLGSNTLVIFALHQPVLRIVRFVGSKLFSNFDIGTNVLLAIVSTVIIIICFVPVIEAYKYISNKYLSKLYIK